MNSWLTTEKYLLNNLLGVSSLQKVSLVLLADREWSMNAWTRYISFITSSSKINNGPPHSITLPFYLLCLFLTRYIWVLFQTYEDFHKLLVLWLNSAFFLLENVHFLLILQVSTLQIPASHRWLGYFFFSLSITVPSFNLSTLSKRLQAS